MHALLQKQEPDFKLDTDALSSWTYALLTAGHPAEAIHIAKLNVQLFPFGPAYSALGEAYARLGRKDEAIDSYKKAVGMAPDNFFFQQRLDTLESPGSPRR